MDSLSYVAVQWLFLKCLALNYLFAFGSLYFQANGLYGSEGITPIAETVSSLQRRLGRKPYLSIPTLFWWNASDRFLNLLPLLGMVAAVLIIVGVAPAPLFLFLWINYLSFFSVGSPFLSFQWDILLLETGFIAIFFALMSPPPILLILLLWILLFRLLFSSGIIKKLSRCPEWKALKAMHYHYETQPLPNRMAYYCHQQPEWVAKLSVLGVYLLEIIVPFLIFFPSPLREVGFFLLLFLQILIFLTGNYAFFNTLTATLCIPLLNNADLSWLFKTLPSIEALPASTPLEIFLNLVAAFLIFLNVLELLSLFYPLGKLDRVMGWVAPYAIINGYGLFARMTTTRYEIVVEGSDDGEEWQTYEFRWKPGNLLTPPKQVAPYHPRLDWQMWFAALSSYHQHPWFLQFLTKLLEGSTDVLKLLRINPFPHEAPKYVRALLYQYHFSDFQTKRATGEWWTRTDKGIYCPTLELRKQKKS